MNAAIYKGHYLTNPDGMLRQIELQHRIFPLCVRDDRDDPHLLVARLKPCAN